MFKKLLAVTAALALTMTGMTLTSPAPAAQADTLIQQNNLQQVKDVFNGINKYRATKGLAPIKIATSISYVSQDWSEQQAVAGKISHRSNFWNLYPKGAMGYGEIVASRGGDSGQGLVDQWINSAPHEALLRGNFNVMGIGVAWSNNGSYERMFGTVNFGRYASTSGFTTYSNVDDWVRATGADTRQDAGGSFVSATSQPGGFVEAKGYVFDYSRRLGASDALVVNKTTGQQVKIRAAEGGYDLTPWDVPGPHGFTLKMDAKPGANNEVCVTALNTFVGGVNKDLGCKTVYVEPLPTVEGMTVTRIGGADRYESSVNISRATHPARTVDTVYLVTGQKFSDALSVAPAAAQAGKGLLLTPTDFLHNSVAGELRRLAPKNVILVGGPDSVSETVASSVKSALPGAAVSRIAGADRYDTSILVARHAFPNAKEAFVVSGEKFTDALSAAPTAALKNAPVILTPRDRVLSVTSDWLAGSDLDRVSVAGGVDTITAAAYSQVASASAGATMKRYAGVDRYETNLMLAAAGTTSEQQTVFLASGEKFPDALSAAATPKTGPLLLSPSTCMKSQTFDMIKDTYSPARLYVLGGEDTLSKGVFNLGTC